MQGTSVEIERLELERVLHSATFRHADQLRHLLGYLGEKSLGADANSLKEYTVGIEALGKPHDYDPRRDAAARIQAGRLRTKLEEYYRNEGEADEIVISLPKGGFRLQFSVKALPPVAEPAAVVPERSRSFLWQGISAALAISLAAVLYWQTPRPSEGNPWKAFFANGRSSILSLGPHMFVFMDGTIVRDWTANRWEDVLSSPRIAAVRQALGGAEPVPIPIYTGLGEMSGALSVSRLFHSYGSDLEFRRSGKLSWEDLKQKNVVLLGSPKTIAHLKDLREFVEGLDFSVEENHIVNRNPRPGERSQYTGQRKPQTMEMIEAYGLVTFLPGVDGRGALMLLGSPDGDGTLVACEAMTTPSILKEMEGRIGGASIWQVLFRARIKDMVPLDTAILAHRRIEKTLPGKERNN